MTAAFRDDRLPTRAAYDLQGIDLRLARLRGDDSDRARGMRSAEVRRMLDRARIRGGDGHIPDDLKDLKDLIVERARTATAEGAGRYDDHRALALGPYRR